MSKPDDRDVRKPHTPPAGVRAQTAPESFEGETPVEGDPVMQINARAKQAASNSKDAAASSKAAFAMIREVRSEVRTYNERDQADHERLFNNYDRLDEKIDTTNSKIDRTNEIVSDIRQTFGTQMGEVNGRLELLMGSLDDERRVRVMSAQAQVEIDKHEKLAAVDLSKQARQAELQAKQTELAEQSKTADFLRTRNLKLYGQIGALLGLIGTIIGFATQC